MHWFNGSRRGALRATGLATLILAACPAAEPEWKTGWWRGQRVTYVETGGVKLWDGDIILDDVDDEPPWARKNSGQRASLYIPLSGRRWPGGVVPYVIQAGFPRPQEVADAMRLWERSTPIRFVGRTTEPNWVRFQTGAGCNSAAGMIGGEQVINLGTAGCGVAATTHEIGHALGLHHEQQRPDRDRYIYPNMDWTNRSAYGAEFEPLFDFVTEGEFDFGSIMLYGREILGNPVPKLLIETIPAGIPANTTSIDAPYISPSLANTVKRMYGATVTDTTIASVPNGRQILVDGVAYTAPRSFDWAVGSTHLLEYPDNQISGRERYQFASWSDGGDRQHRITLTELGRVYTAHATREIRLAFGTSPNGRIAISPEAQDGYYLQAHPVTLTAVPDAGYFFETFYGATEEWRVGLGLGTNPVTYLPWAPGAQPFAGFRPNSYRPTTVTANWPYVRLSLDGVDRLGPISPGFWAPGSSHTVAGKDQLHWQDTARYVFEGWTDGAPAERTITADGGVYVASFRRQYKVTSILSRGGSTAFARAPDASPAFFNEGSQVTVVAIPASGFRFAGWARDAAGVSPAVSLTVDRPLVVEALFAGDGQSVLLGADSLLFRTTAGSSPASQAYELISAGTARTEFAVVTPDPWVRVAASSTSAPATLTVSVNATGFKPGKYRSPVRIESPAAINSRKILYVELWVEPTHCAFSLAAPASPVPAAGGMAIVQLTASDVNCNWAASTGSSQIRPAYTSGSGSYTLPVSFPANPGARRTVELTAAGLRATLAQVGKAAQLRVVSGAVQSGFTGETLSAPLVVELVDSAGMAVPSAPVEVSATGASVPPSSRTSFTDSGGRISVPVTLGSAVGTAILTLRAAGVAALEVKIAVQLGPPRFAPAAAVHAATLQPGPVAPEQLVTLQGIRFTDEYRPASGETLPTELGGVRVTLTDSAGREHVVGLRAVAPSQISFQVPPEVKIGPARIRLVRADGEAIETDLTVESVAPGLFSADGTGTGAAAGEAQWVDPADNSQRQVELYRCPDGGGTCKPTALDYPSGPKVYLVLYGTGFRRAALSDIKVEVGGEEAAVLYAGTHPTLPGFDRLNIEAPVSARRRGLLGIRLSVGGNQSNTVRALFAPEGLLHRYSFSGDARDSIQETPMTLSPGAVISDGALILDGATGYAWLPPGVVSELTSCTLEAWVTMEDVRGVWSRIFDFGSGPGQNMFLTPSNGASLTPRFAITTAGAAAEQQLTAPGTIPRGVETHFTVVIDAADRTGTLYINGAPVAENRSMSLTPAAMGRTTQNWLGRSQYVADPNFRGRISEFRIHGRALSADEVAAAHAAGPDMLP